MIFKEYFQFAHPTRIVGGHGMIASLGFEFAKDGAKRPLIVTDRVVRETGLIEKAQAGLADGGLEVAGIFDDVPQDSGVDVVEACAAAASEHGCDSLVAIGGGSVMDTAKVANAILVHGGSVLDYEGLYQLPRTEGYEGAPLALRPLACVPTTAGTGSEVSFGAVIKDAAQGAKISLGDFPFFPALAILDPEATRTLPPAIAASTGMDAMTHAIEGYVSTEWTPHGDAFATQALKLMRENLARAVHTPADDDARGNMLIAAAMAIVPGAAANIALGATHSMSHPAGARHGVPHGVANAINLPHVVRFNAGDEAAAARYRDIAELLGVEGSAGADEVGEGLAAWVSELTISLGLPQRLSEVGVPEAGIPDLVEGAMGDGCTLTNPRELTEEDFTALYQAAL